MDEAEATAQRKLGINGFLEKALVVAGAFFCLASAIGITYGIWLVFTTGSARRQFIDNRDVSLSGLLALNIDLVAILLFSGLATMIGLSFFKSAGRSTNYVVRPEDRDLIWPLITEPKPEGIDQYIRLASLSGFSGAFTKVGFTGLPLATVALTIFFVVLALSSGNKDLMELAKLTLGAFIGSFVQRQTDRVSAGRDASGRGASAERLPV